MASETLSVPEEHLREVIDIIRAGLEARRKARRKVSREVREQLEKWCNEEEGYLNRAPDNEVDKPDRRAIAREEAREAKKYR